MNTTEKIVNSLDDKLSKYKQPVTILSKTDDNEFIIEDAQMFDWDEISKLYSDGDESSSVDAIYFSLKNNELTIYLFEFKNLSLFDKFFDARKQLDEYINDLEECIFGCCYPKEMRKVKSKLVSKKVVSLKTKPLESLILLHKILNEYGISSEEIVKIRKEYYIVSKTPLNNNKANWHRKGKSGEIFGFIDKIKPFPFIKVDHLNEKTFLSLIRNLKENDSRNI